MQDKTNNKDIIQDKVDQEKNKRKEQLEDIRKIMKTSHGIRFFKRLFEHGRIFQTTFTGNSQTFFLEGHRNLGLIFFNDVAEACPKRIGDLIINKGKEDTDGR